jgi:hypothetical protein
MRKFFVVVAALCVATSTAYADHVKADGSFSALARGLNREFGGQQRCFNGGWRN